MIKVPEESLIEYLKSITQNYKLGIAVEETHRPAFVNLIEGLGDGLHAVNEAKRIECGSPDIPIYKNDFPLGYVEFKDIGKDLNAIEKTQQLQDYLEVLPNLILSDYLEFRWFIKGKFIKSINIASAIRDGKIEIDKNKLVNLAKLLEEFLNQNVQSVETPSELSIRMAHIARCIRDNLLNTFMKGQESDTVKDIRMTLSHLIPDIIEPSMTIEFTDMYAQTIVYGLFVARCNHRGPGQFSRATAAADIPKSNPFVRSLFENIMGTALDDEPYYYLVENMLATLSNTDVEKILGEFTRQEGRDNPVIHFYETFLTEYDKETQKERGVYYTPEPVVSYIIESVDWLLKNRFGIKDGVADTQTIQYKETVCNTVENKNSRTSNRNRNKKAVVVKNEVIDKTCHKVLILDPACGTGAFLYGTIRFIRYSFMENNNAGLWAGYVKEHLIPRLFGFEILIAPYTISHFNLMMELKGQDLTPEARKKWAYTDESTRLNVYLTDTLKESEIHEDYYGPLFRHINQEIHQSDAIKNDFPVMVIMGNPPYNVTSTNTYDISEYKKIDGKPLKEKTWNSIHDDYVKFIRWAQNRIENTHYGIIAFITNHGYIDNITFRGMRKSLMDSFDEIYILDLHGDALEESNHENENVFSITKGVSIGLFVKLPNTQKTPHETSVKHAEIWGTRDNKFNYLVKNNIATTSWNELKPTAPNYMFKTLAKGELSEEYDKLYNLSDIFINKSTGIETGNDTTTYSFNKKGITEVINDFTQLPSDECKKKYFKAQTKSGSGWTFEKAKNDIINSGADLKYITEVLYRPFDIRYTYYTGKTAGFLRRPCRDIMSHIINKNNLMLVTTRQVHSRKFEHAIITNKPVNVNVLQQAMKCVVYPLYIYDGDTRTPNISREFVDEIKSHLNLIVDPSPEDIIYYIYAILYSPKYRKRYADLLIYDYPKIPLTSNIDKFKALVKQGKTLSEIHLLTQVPVLINLSYPIDGNNIISKINYQDNKLFINENQYLEGVPDNVFNYVIGAHQVVYKWLDARKGQKLEYDDINHLKKILNIIAFTIEIQKEIDKIIGELPLV